MHSVSHFCHYVNQFYSHRESSNHLVSHLPLHSTHAAITEKAYWYISRILDYFICVLIRYFNWGMLLSLYLSLLHSFLQLKKSCKSKPQHCSIKNPWVAYVPKHRYCHLHEAHKQRISIKGIQWN